MSTSIPHKNQIRWACRRGMLELDCFLLPFFDHCYDDLTTADQQAFVALLNESDQDLNRWLLAITPPPAHFAVLIQKIVSYAKQTL